VASEVPAPDVFPLAQPQAALAPAADPDPGVAGPAVRAAAVAPEVEAADEAAPGGRTAPAPAVEADLAEAAPVGREVRVSALPAPVPAVEADPVEAAPVGRAVRVSALPALAPAVTAGRADRAAPDGLEPVQQAALAPDAEVPERAPRTYGSSSAETRVVLRARDNAWVHVSSTNNDYLWVQTLRPGDRFIVPARPDLVLWTGNAGGVEVLVDGALLPALGPEAVVVRDVSLQPRALLRRLLPLPADHAGVSDLASAAKPPMMPPSSR
jgi:cytoskeleton protein RodZ